MNHPSDIAARTKIPLSARPRVRAHGRRADVALADSGPRRPVALIAKSPASTRKRLPVLDRSRSKDAGSSTGQYQSRRRAVSKTAEAKFPQTGRASTRENLLRQR